ncbi:ATP-binding protein [Sandaracinobacteroides hominis]|uniref:ATP-binding protein n=1 Tax=Sandaracinobacteroides hominis TaxID=2780086 RepID=UPI0018F7C23D|nr:ATP-binding protein [Sandaracinobacteroides hominis]
MSIGLGVAGGVAAEQAGLPVLLWLPFILIVIFLVYRASESPVAEYNLAVTLKPRAHIPQAVDEDGRIGISALADPAMLVSRNWRVLAANDGAMALFGRRIVGADLRQTVRHPVVLDAVRLGMQGQSPTFREVTTLGSRDGAFGIRVVADGSRLLLSFNDITQARLTERMRVDFVANASHELRTPLANISGFIETLLGPASEDEPARRRFLDIMSREAGRMSRLIDDLLSLSRIELDKYVRPQTMLELPPLLLDVGKTLAVRLEADDRKLTLEVEANLPQVVADRDQILQVLHNLISNALKYGRTGTPILVSAAREPGGREEMVRVSVVDEGDGIAPEHLPRLTERFYRVDTGRSRSMGGTGLGLAIVKHIVERHRGRLDISSRQGAGTTVSFLLPVQVVARPAEGETLLENSARD